MAWVACSRTGAIGYGFFMGDDDKNRLNIGDTGWSHIYSANDSTWAVAGV